MKDYPNPADSDVETHVKPDPETGKLVTYLRRKDNGSGEAVEYLARSTVFYKWLGLVKRNGYTLDNDLVYKNYMEKLVPRAAGYAGALVDYFYRGNIEIEPVADGLSFRTFRLKARNISPNGEEMEPGEVALVVRYKDLKESPLAGARYVVHLSSDEYSYKIAKLQNVTIPRDAPVELTFDFSADMLPINFDDISIQLVYKGKLGQEDGSVAVSELKELAGVNSDLFLSLPSSGVFAKIDATENEFSELRVTALTDIPGGITLTGGKIELALEYRRATTSPFENQTINLEPAEDWSYIIRVPEKNGVTTLQEGVPVELVFDLSSAPLPIFSADVYINIVCTSTDAEGNVKTSAIGFLDISEPTPVDIFNLTNKVCINNKWLEAGSTDAIAPVDIDYDGKADLADVYQHALDNIYSKLSAVDVTSYASSSNYTFASPDVLAPGGYRRLGYVLTDYNFKSSYDGTWHNISPDDAWTTVSEVKMYDNKGFKLQTDYDGTFHYNAMSTINGQMYWGGAGIVFVNRAYPDDSLPVTSHCSLDSLQ